MRIRRRHDAVADPGDFCYVDKTSYARRSVDDADKHYFLSCPRRFGKRLFVEILKEPFHHGWDWPHAIPLVRQSFGSGNFKRPSVMPASHGSTAPGVVLPTAGRAAEPQAGQRVVVSTTIRSWASTARPALA